MSDLSRAANQPPSHVFSAPGSVGAIGNATGNNVPHRSFIYNNGDTLARQSTHNPSSFDKYQSRALSGMYKPLRVESAYDRHKSFINNYVLFYGQELKRDESRDKTDADVLRESYRFIRTSEDNDDATYEKRIAKRYYDKLFKEYCLADLSRYRKNQFGMRWRTQAEVFEGKGQFICGSIHCKETKSLKSYEVEFRYKEAGEKKVALVKLRVCQECAFKLNYKHYKRLANEQRAAKKAAKQTKKKRPMDDNDDKSNDEDESSDDSTDSKEKQASRASEAETRRKHKRRRRRRLKQPATDSHTDKPNNDNLLTNRNPNNRNNNNDGDNDDDNNNDDDEIASIHDDDSFEAKSESATNIEALHAQVDAAAQQEQQLLRSKHHKSDSSSNKEPFSDLLL